MSRINRSYMTANDLQEWIKQSQIGCGCDECDQSALKVLLITDCDDCPYYNSYYNYRIECTLQLDDEFCLSRQLRYKEKGYETTKAELFSKCPLVNCLGENIITYYKLLDEDL